MIKILTLWLMVAFPKEACVKAHQPKEVLVTTIGTTETFKTTMPNGEIPKVKFDFVVGEKPDVPKNDCYDVYLAKIGKFKGELQNKPEPKSGKKP